jgi:hypothetical protein
MAGGIPPSHKNRKRKPGVIKTPKLSVHTENPGTFIDTLN